MNTDEGAGKDVEENTVSLGAVFRMPESSVDDFIKLLGSVPGVRVIYKKVALYELYITAKQPKGVQ
ncbi:MAG: hypothetical protein AB9819_07395 [Methanomassiliicoccales archaeon]